MLQLDNVKIHFPIRGGAFGRRAKVVRAVDGVSLSLDKGEALGLVGESGCGKTTIGMSVMGLIPLTEGTIRIDNQDITSLTESQMNQLRRKISMVFQDPYSSLNPRMTIRQIVGEPLVIHGIAGRATLTDRVLKLLREVGLDSYHMKRYPHEFSGGQRQRVGIARALALDASLIIFDEPTSALDVSVQAQILKLIWDLRQRRGLSYLLVSHDLGVVKSLCERVAVMYLGKIVEDAPTDRLFHEPAHPYSRALLSAVPSPSLRKHTGRIILPGTVPSPINPPDGCRFKGRCFEKIDGQCREEEPDFVTLSPGHRVACWRYVR